MTKRVLLTGATGGMGSCVLEELLKNCKNHVIRILVRKSENTTQFIEKFKEYNNLEVLWGDLSNFTDANTAVRDCDMILHVAAFVSPAADYHPDIAMKVNYGGTKNLIDAINKQQKADYVKFVYIGTVAETGDRMPPIHWGRVGDPIKPSVYDYYAVSKIAAERYLIESGLKYWVSLRQTGIIGPAMSKIKDAIMFHNCLNNVLEYVSDRDSGIMLKNLWIKDQSGELPMDFWNHIYNIGGGESCRTDTYSMFERLYGDIGIKNMNNVVKPKMFATRNFHGQYYLDSDKLNNYLNFRNDSMEYYYDCYLKDLGKTAALAKTICKLPGGQKLMGSVIGKMFAKEAKSEHGTVNFIQNNLEPQIAAYWGSKKAWEQLPDKANDFERFKDWDKVIHVDHGYDETKPESELELSDIKRAAEFRGGKLLSKTMKKGDWTTQLDIECAFGHRFKASPRLVLEGGHWCDECERKSWNFAERAKRDPFFAQVWYPLHDKDEPAVEYKKVVNELDI